MKVALSINSKEILITDEHSASSYGRPVAVVDGIAYGAMDELPVWGEDDELNWIEEPAFRTVASAVGNLDRAGTPLTRKAAGFVMKFWNQR